MWVERETERERERERDRERERKAGKLTDRQCPTDNEK